MFDFNQLTAYAVDISFWLAASGVVGFLTGWFYCGPKGWSR